MSGPRYEYDDEAGIALAVTTSSERGPLGDISAVTVQGEPECRVLAEHRVEVAAGLWTGAGLPAPVILERPREIAQVIIMPGASYSVRGNDIEATATCKCGTSGQLLSTAAVRDFAAALACLCDVADSEPDPAEVEELTRVLRGCVPGMAPPGGDYKTAVARGFAEAALRWMKQREAGGAA